MRNYEVTFIVDPVLSGDEIKATAKTYEDHLKGEGCKITHIDEMGLRQLAYPIKNRTSGIYYCIEFEAENGSLIAKLELAFRRDERIMRFLTISLDKYGVKYNDDKRKGLIGKKKPAKAKAEGKEKAPAKKTAPARKAAPAKKAAPAPAPVAVAEPLASPLQVASASAVAVTVTGVGSRISTLVVSEQPFASVTVTICVPAFSNTAVALVSPVSQAKV